MYERLIKAGYAKSDEEFREITQFFYEKLPKLDYDTLGFREKLWYFKAHVWYSFLIQDFLSTYRYAAKWIEMFEEKPSMIAIHPVFYLKACEASPLPDWYVQDVINNRCCRRNYEIQQDRTRFPR